MFFSCNDKQMEASFALPMRVGGRTYPTPEHYAMSSLVGGDLSRLTLSDARVAFNRMDEGQYIRTVREACDRFNEKKCRSTASGGGGKTIGHLARELLRKNNDFVCATDANTPFRSVAGAEDLGGFFYGYNLVGLSLSRLRRIFAKLPAIPGGLEESLFWRMHPEEEDIKKTTLKTHKGMVPRKRGSASAKAAAVVAAAGGSGEAELGFLYEPDEDDDEHLEEEAGFYPDEVAVYTDKRVRWVPTSANFRVDDLRAVGDMLYASEAMPTDPLRAKLPPEADDHYIYCVAKAAAYLVERMENGWDIEEFINQPVDVILARSGTTIGTAPPGFKEAFLAKATPHYQLIRDELSYPQNLAGFTRKAHADKLNANIGKKIREILFASFLYQVVEKYYPNVAPGLRVVALRREASKFSTQEQETMTDKLYQLFFKGKFVVDEEGARRIALLEQGRLTEDAVANALRFVPRKNTIEQPCLEVGGTVLDPTFQTRVRIDGKEFDDLYQYAYYKLFLLYGAQDAYDLVAGRRGNDPRLAGVLAALIEKKKDDYTAEAARAMLAQHAQTQEALAYARTTGKETEEPWDNVQPDPDDLRLMEWVVSIIPGDDKHHADKSARLFAFVRDVARSAGVMRSLLGKRVRGRSLEAFVRCFYPKLATIAAGSGTGTSTTPPASFVARMKGAVAQEDITSLWRVVAPFARAFRQKTFVPSELFREAKELHPSATKEDAARALAAVVKCLYKEGEEVPNDHFYLLVSLMSGRDDAPMWPDPSYEMVMETTGEGDRAPDLSDLPEKIRKKFPKRKRPAEAFRTVRHDIFHPDFDEKQMREWFGDKNAARASHAADALYRQALHPRRITFYI